MYINRYWREGKHFDLWSINHLLSGVVLAAVLFNLNVDFKMALLAATVLFVGWELFEIAIGIKEHLPNMIVDVLCDLFGFLAVSYFYFIVGNTLSWNATFVWIAIFAVFNIWGFIAYEKRKLGIGEN